MMTQSLEAELMPKSQVFVDIPVFFYGIQTDAIGHFELFPLTYLFCFIFVIYFCMVT